MASVVEDDDVLLGPSARQTRRTIWSGLLEAVRVAVGAGEDLLGE